MLPRRLALVCLLFACPAVASSEVPAAGSPAAAPAESAAGAPAEAARTFVDAARTVAVDPSRGVDPAVDYAALVRFGPWDDRNYALTAADLKVLSPTEATQRDPVPAFFRVALRRARPDLPQTGPVQYPRNALQLFQLHYGGYRVDGRDYRYASRAGDRFVLRLDDGVEAEKDGLGDALESLSGELRLTFPNGAAESAIKANPANANAVVAGVNGPSGGQWMYWSADGGSTWTRTDLPQGNTCCDPAVDWSSTGTYAYATSLTAGFSPTPVYFYRSNDGGKTWNGLESVTPGDPRREIGNGADKEYLHVDKYANSPFKDRIYLTWHRSNNLQFAYSADFGNTFTTSVIGNTTADQGIGSDITTDKQGNVYYLWPGFNSKTIRLRKSTNGGQTFNTVSVVANTQASYDFPLPSMETRRAFVYVSADADVSNGTYGNSVYVAWTDATAATTENPADNHAVIHVAYSRNGGSTWTVTTPHETADAQAVDRWHPWLAVGSDGTVHVIYYDTRRDPGRTSVDLFYSYSKNGAQTWSTPQRVTTVASDNIQDGFEFGDYNGLDIVLSQLIAIFTDNRREGGGFADSVDVYAAGIPPGTNSVCGNGLIEAGEVCDGANVGAATCATAGCTGGGTLACKPGCGGYDTSNCNACPDTVAGALPDTPDGQVRVAAQGADLKLTWGGACAPVQDYEVYEGQLFVVNSHLPKLCSTGGQTAATITPAAGNRYYLVVAANRGVEGSYGTQSDGAQRAPSASACLPQALGFCP